MVRFLPAFLMMAAGLLAPLPCRAADFTGRVLLPDGAPAFGAMLTVFNDGKIAKLFIPQRTAGSRSAPLLPGGWRCAPVWPVTTTPRFPRRAANKRGRM